MRTRAPSPQGWLKSICASQGFWGTSVRKEIQAPMALVDRTAQDTMLHVADGEAGVPKFIWWDLVKVHIGEGREANLILWVGFCTVLFLLLHLNEWYKLICYILSCPINTGILLIKVTCMFWGPQKSSNTYVHIHTYVHTPIDLPLAGLKQIEYFHHLSLPSIIDWNVSFKILIYYLILLPAVFVDLKPNFYIGNIIWHS